MAFMKLLLLALSAMAVTTVGAYDPTELQDSCQFNTYMCCWTQNPDGVQKNTDVCAGAPQKTSGGGKKDKYAGDAEGDVHCHGFVWPDDASYNAYVLPLYKFVIAFDHKKDRGYSGR